MKPWIGITASIELNRLNLDQANAEAIYRAGGVPLILPNLNEQDIILQWATKLDGLLLTGGGDIQPFLFGEEPHPNLRTLTPLRDEVEAMLISAMLKQDKPILGICRGCQILNVAAGGDMYQDIHSQLSGHPLQHAQNAPRDFLSHSIQVEAGSLLYQVVKKETMKVNSFHHQAVRKLANGFQVCAKAPDGVIEAFYGTQHQFVLGVQWHPENLFEKNKESFDLFRAFVNACNKENLAGAKPE